MQQKATSDALSILRPQDHCLLVGHEAKLAMIQRAANRQCMPHGWLFTGLKGIGKATTAYRCAREILLGSDKVSSLPEYHPDLCVIEKKRQEKTGKMEAEIKIEQVREIAEFLAYTRASSPYRVIIIDSVDDLTVNAANALLKHLEEPPPETVFLLINHRPECILPTIVSRCIQVRFQPLSNDQVHQVLTSTLSCQNVQDPAWLSAYASGSPGMAVTLLAAGGDQWLEGWIRLLHRWPVYAMDDVHSFINQVLATRSDEVFTVVLYILYRLLSRMVACQTGGAHAAEPLEVERQLFYHKPFHAKAVAFIPVIQQIGAMVTDPKMVHAERAATLLSLFEQLQKC